MHKAQKTSVDSHAELIQLASDLMSEIRDTERWLPQYDAALASRDNRLLVQFCREVRQFQESPAQNSDVRAVSLRICA